MPVNFEILDWLAAGIYAAAVLTFGFVIARRKESGSTSAEDFVLAGRKLTIPLFAATLVATWYGNILGSGEIYYGSGVAGWAAFGLPYYLAAGLFAVFLAGKIRTARSATVPEQIGKAYGSGAAKASAAIVLVITIPAAYLLSLGAILKLFTGLELWICIVAGALISLVYLFTGGFKADIYANAVQFLFMFVGFGLLLVFAVEEFGGFPEMIARLPESNLSFKGNLSWQYLLVWWIISLQTFVDPSFHQRCAAAGTPRTAQIGIGVSIFFWAVFDFLTLSSALYAKAYLPTEALIQIAGGADELIAGNYSLLSFPALAEAILPPFAKGLFFASIAAVIMSTLDSYAFISAATIGVDIINPLRMRFKNSPLSAQKATRIGLVLTAIFATALAIVFPSAVDLIYKTASIAVPALLAPLAASYFPKIKFRKNEALAIMIVSASAAMIWTILKESLTEPPKFLASIETMFVGLIISLILSAIFIIYKSIRNEKQSF